jgi:glutamate decarboxylase
MRFSTTVAALLYSPVAALAATPVKQSLSAHDFLTRVTPKLLSYVEGQDDVSKKTMTLKSPAELTQIFDDLGVPLEMGSDPVDSMLLLDACDAVMEYGLRTGSPLFNNQLFGTADPVAIAGDWLTTVSQTSSYTYEVAPVFSMMETELIAKLGSVVGGDFAKREKVDGLFVPGGSLSNLYALQVARFRACPAIKKKGNAAAPGLCAFVSDEAHYSYKKSCSLLGLGTDSLYRVPSDPGTGAMDPQALKGLLQEAKAKGEKPFFVGCTAGTTVLGAFDPFGEVRKVVDEFNAEAEAEQAAGGFTPGVDDDGRVWMHVDGAWGGGAIFSERERSKCMKGLEGTDSFCTNPHKMMGSTLQCCCFMTRHPDLLMAANSANAAYLFQPDKENTELDYGDKTIQCGRKVDTFKLWLMWKYLGDAGMERRVDHLVDLANYMSDRIKDTLDDQGRRVFVQVAPTSFTNVVFYAIPPSLRVAADVGTSNEAVLANLDMEALSKVAPAVKSQMQRRGLALIGFQPVKTFPNCWRMVFAGAKESSMTTETVDTILDSMRDISEELFG